ncbi:MAG: protein kinase domain-containing protein [Myxococcota bacterium]
MSLSSPAELRCPSCDARYPARRLRAATRPACFKCRVPVEGAPDEGEIVYLYAPNPSRVAVTPRLNETWSGEGAAGEGPQALGTVGRYRIFAELGRGGMGVVYRAWDEDLGRFVALKLLLAGGHAAHAEVERFLREARSAARLTHPHIVRVHDIGRHDGQVFFTMDLVEGPSLQDVVDARGAFPPDEALRVAARIAEGLHHAHAQGLVHRDMKPANVLLEPDGHPVVTDFGLAKDFEGGAGLTATGQLLGTPAYMPPEQAAGKLAEVGPRSDVYALGAVLYEMLVGAPPYQGTHAMEVVMQVLAEGPPPPRARNPDVPLAAQLVCLKAMERDPARRYPSAAALAEDLERARRGEPVEARPPSRFDRLAHWLNVHRRPVAAAAATLAVVGALALGAVVWRSGKADEAARAREARAEERRAGMEARIDALVAAGRAEEAEQAFESFVAVDEHAGTRALTLAWLARAARMRDAGRPDDALAAFATAYSSSGDGDEQGLALLGIASSFREEGRWDRMAVVLDTLALRRPALAATPEVAAMRVEAALARRDLAGARAAAAGTSDPAWPAAAALAAATPTPWKRMSAVPDGDRVLIWGDDVPEVVIAAPRPDLPRRAAFTLDLGPPSLLAPFPDLGVLLAWHTRAPGGATATLYRAGDPQPLLRWAENTLHATLSADVDRDGVEEIYVGTGAFGRHLWRVDGDRLSVADPGTDAIHSDVTGLAAGDFDGDGAPELAAAVGPWSAFDVRVFDAAPGGITRVARRRMGYVPRLAVLPDPGGAGDLLAVAKADRFPSRVIFPADAPYGEPAGVYLMRVEDDKLARVAWLPMPAAARDHALRTLMAADVDGDGRHDLVADTSGARAGEGALIAWRQADAGDFAPVVLGGITLLATAELDGDAATELIVQLEELDRAVWTLGAGDTELPLLATRTSAPVGEGAPPYGVDAALARVWARAEDLAAMGLGGRAVDALLGLATLAGDPVVEARANLRAAELRESEGDVAGAASLYEAAARDPDLAEVATASAIRCHLAAHAWDEARRLGGDHPLLAAIAATPPGPVLTFDAPLHAAWSVDDPIALTRADGVLRVDSFGDQGPIATLPLTRAGPRLRVEVDLEVDRAELGTSLLVSARPRGGPPEAEHVGFAVHGMGGGAMWSRQVGCLFPGHVEIVGPTIAVASPTEALAARAVVEWVPAQREAWCRVEDARGVAIVEERVEVAGEPSGADWELAIESRPDRGVDGAMWTSVRMRRLAIEGAVVGAPVAEAGPRLLADGDDAGALAQIAPTSPLRRVWRALAWERLGRAADAASELREGLVGFGPGVRRVASPEVLAAAHLARIRPTTFGPLARRALGDRWFDLYWYAMADPIWNYRLEPDLQRSLLADLGGVEASAGTGDAARHRYALLTWRGLARWRLLGDAESARADLRRALAWSASLPDGDDSVNVATLRRDAWLELASIEVATGRDDAALAAARRAIALAPAPELAIDLLRRDPRIAAKGGEPGWGELLR